MDSPIAYTSVANDPFERAAHRSPDRRERLSYTAALAVVMSISLGLWALVIAALRLV